MEIREPAIIETERLLIRSAGPYDSKLLFTIWTDPRVMINV